MATGILIQEITHLDLQTLTANTEPEADARDRAWLKRIASGDEAALNEVYLAYGQRLFAFGMRLTGDPAQSEDAVQETLLAVWNSAGRFRGQGRVVAWMLGILHHSAMNLMRKQKRQVSFDLADTLADDRPAPEENLQVKDQTDRLRLSLAHLSLEHREVLELVFYQKLDLQEVAQVLHCPLGTVKSRLSYARKQLRGEWIRSEAGKEGEA